MENIRQLIANSNIFGSDHGHNNGFESTSDVEQNNQNGGMATATASVNTKILSIDPLVSSDLASSISMIEPPSADDNTSPDDDDDDADCTFVDDDHAAKKNNRISIDSTYELLDYNSPDDLARSDVSWNKIHTPAVASSSETVETGVIQKKTENTYEDERDTHSPINAIETNSNSLVHLNIRPPLPNPNQLANTEENHMSNRRGHFGSGDYNRPSSKEEKQRQNEGIVIMESSSVSSETGSWESVFPQHSPLELKEYCKLFLINERRNTLQYKSTVTVVQTPSHPPPPPPQPQTRSPASIEKGSFEVETETTECCSMDISAKPTSARGACFIDASSLLDDTEITFPADIIGPKLPDIACCGPCPQTTETPPNSQSDTSPSPPLVGGTKGKDLKANDLFDVDKLQKRSSKNNTPDLTSPNLSDEQKLLHRDCEQRTEYDIKDQYSSDSSTDQKIFTSYGETTNSDRESHGSGGSGGDGCDGNGAADDSDKESKLRQLQERKKGNFLFKNSIQHFSGHVMNAKGSFSDRDDNFTDYSLPSIQSNPSDVEFNAFDHGSDASNVGPYSRTFSETESVFYPDTPHNSIINIESPRCSSRNGEPPSSSSSSTSSSSSPVIGVQIPKRIQKCDESAPILSGGVCAEDFTPKQCSSPAVVRRSEACPIICTGAIPPDFLDELKPKKTDKPRNVAMNTWVVDMSDCNAKNRRQRSESSSSSTDNTATNSKSLDTRTNDLSSNGHKSGLGFYVSLNDIKSQNVADEPKEKIIKAPTEIMSESKKMSTGFYVNLSDADQKKPIDPPSSTGAATGKVPDEMTESTNGATDKKSIFSMFIDFGEKATTTLRGPSSFPSRLASSIHRDQIQSQSDSDNASITDSTTNPRDYNRSSSSDVVRRSMSSSGGNPNKRHSWNTSKDRPEKLSEQHSRSSSVSGDKNIIMNILDKVPHLSKTSSMSVDSPNSPYDDFTCSKSLDSYSNNSNSLTSISIHSSIEHKLNPPEIPAVMTASARRRQKDAKINETFDKSSQGSLTDGILSKDSSPTTDTDDITFQNDVEPPSVVMETIVESIETASPQKKVPPPSKIPAKIETHTMETLQATIEKQKMLLETVSEEVQLSSFVKLSDMDKPIQKFELHTEENLSKSVGSSRIGRLFVDTKSRNTIHNNMSRSTGTNLTHLASSVENLRSLSRLFPHLSKELSSSLPADIQTEDLIKKSPSSECAQLDMFSCTSSLTSSFSRSGIDSADESSLSCRQPRRLGEDLLKMFLQEIATDVVIEVGGRRMKAHKCILRSRCQYFAAMLAGAWVQSAGNVISITGYSYGSVHFALCHIYSGASHPPDGISLMELSALADLLGLEGLKEVTAHALRTNYCHNFHKPCSGCIDGIMQVFPITLNHGLDELYRKCLRWTCRYFAKVWPTRAFAQLPSDLVGRCKQHIVAHITSESVLTTIIEFDQLISLLAPCRWAIGVENTVRDIIDIAHSYISDHFANLLASDGFLSLGHGQSWNISRLENVLLRVASTLTPEQACKSYQRVTRLNAVLAAKVIKLPSPGLHIHEFGDDDDDEEEMDWNPEFIRLVGSILSAVEQCLTRQCARAMRNSQWLRMDAELRSKIQKLACLSDPVEMRNAKSSKPLGYNLTMNNNRNQNLHQIKLAMRAHSKQPPTVNNQYRATTHTQTNYSDCSTETIDRSVQANHESRSNLILKSSSSAHVPDVVPSIKYRPDDNGSSNYYGHRRSHSETISTKPIAKPQLLPQPVAVTNCKAATSEKPKTPKLSEIKPRYLEPRARSTGIAGAVRTNSKPSATKTKNISSSGSSTRNSSPLPNKRNSIRTKPTTAAGESINMSRDSLASPAKQSKPMKNKNRGADYDHSIDSLGDSLKSSIKTDKTLSQESLVKCNVKSASKELLHAKPITYRSNSVGAGANNNNKITNNVKNGLNKIKLSSCQTTTENSPASAATTKSSRLSSIGSTVSSPRDSYRASRSTVSAASASSNGTNQPTIRKSFLSAKSKEILAKKQSLNQSESAKSVPNVLKEKQMIPVNKSHSTSNILNRRPNPFSTTLHLRRTAKLNVAPSTVAAPLAAVPAVRMNVPTKNGTAVVDSMKSAWDNRNGKTKTQKKPLKITVEIETEPTESIEYCEPSIRIESRLERSSTFCKDSSDIPVGNLQIIE